MAHASLELLLNCFLLTGLDELERGKICPLVWHFVTRHTRKSSKKISNADQVLTINLKAKVQFGSFVKLALGYRIKVSLS